MSAAGFRAVPGGVTVRFARPQAAIIRDLVGQVAELVGGEDATGPGRPARHDELGEPGELEALVGLAGTVKPPDDPVLARLLPDAYRDDPEAAAEFRRFTDAALRSEKVEAARTVLATLPPAGGRVRLSEPDAHAWLRALNDVRLALGVRLGVTEDFEQQAEETGPEDPRYPYLWVYQWLTYLQDSLVEALD
jgi:hypothetical protein